MKKTKKHSSTVKRTLKDGFVDSLYVMYFILGRYPKTLDKNLQTLERTNKKLYEHVNKKSVINQITYFAKLLAVMLNVAMEMSVEKAKELHMIYFPHGLFTFQIVDLNELDIADSARDKLKVNVDIGLQNPQFLMRFTKRAMYVLKRNNIELYAVAREHYCNLVKHTKKHNLIYKLYK